MQTNESNVIETPQNPSAAAGEDSVDCLVGHFRERLQWEPHPKRHGHLRGFLRDRPNLTLFWIELCEDNPERGRLLGAVIPDDDERAECFSRSKVWYLQNIAAPQYIAEFVAYLSNSDSTNSIQ